MVNKSKIKIKYQKLYFLRNPLSSQSPVDSNCLSHLKGDLPCLSFAIGNLNGGYIVVNGEKP